MEARLELEPRQEDKPAAEGAEWTSNLTRGAYESMVDAAREHILAGDAFQVVLSQRFSKRLGARPFDVYRCLRTINPFTVHVPPGTRGGPVHHRHLA